MIEPSPMIGAIDVGSNAVRLAIGRAQDGGPPEVLQTARESVRLGRDVFSRGTISATSARRLMHALQRFRGRLRQAGVTHWAAVATSALREAANGAAVIRRLARATGIELRIIGGEEEARLVHLAIARQVDLTDKRALLIDVGGGSVEVTIADHGQIVATESFRLGAVRLLHQLSDSHSSQARFDHLVRESVDAARHSLRQELGRRPIDCCVATGGNVEALADLQHQYWGGKNESLHRSHLESLISRLQSLTVSERVRLLRLRKDRADVIVPGAVVLQQILHLARVDEVVIPHVGVKEGLLLDLGVRLRHEEATRYRDQAITSAQQLGRKYRYDEAHARAVAVFARQLFDQTQPIHQLDAEYRLVLELAALLHEIGHVVSDSGHHKHTHYLVSHASLLGLTDLQREIVANVARYHRKSMPRLDHEPYRALPSRQRPVVTKLAALLRLADALDKEHAGRVKDLQVELRRRRVALKLFGRGDLLLERWALARKADLFERVFGWTILASKGKGRHRADSGSSNTVRPPH